MLVPLPAGLISPEWSLLYPQLIVFGLALVLLAFHAFVPKEQHFRLLTAVSLIGYALAAVALWTQDGKNQATFWWVFRADGLTVFLSLVILVAVAGELTAEQQLTTTDTLLVIATLALAWTFANMVYALHYAHLFYSSEDGGHDLGGLDFPGKRPEPDYWDFVYFSFTLGVALQTSDVCITSSGIRRVVTLHCIAAFVFNLGVLAMAINILSG